MSSARLRQAACRLASAAASSASAASPGRTPARFAGMGHLVAKAGGETAIVAHKALAERTPCRSRAGSEHGPLRVWAAMLDGWRARPVRHTTATRLAAAGFPEVLDQVGAAGWLRLLAVGGGHGQHTVFFQLATAAAPRVIDFSAAGPKWLEAGACWGGAGALDPADRLSRPGDGSDVPGSFPPRD